MVGRSPVAADEDQGRALSGLARSRDRGEADRARAILPTLSGWTGPAVAAAFGVQEDTARLWRSALMQGGAEAPRTRVPPGPAPTKAERALEVAEAVLAAPVADRPNRTPPRLAEELDRRWGPGPGEVTRPVVPVLGNGPIRTGRATRAALGGRAHRLAAGWLPRHAPGPNGIEPAWRDLKRHHLAHRTFTGPDGLDRAIHGAVAKPNSPLTKSNSTLGTTRSWATTGIVSAACCVGHGAAAFCQRAANAERSRDPLASQRIAA